MMWQRKRIKVQSKEIFSNFFFLKIAAKVGPDVLNILLVVKCQPLESLKCRYSDTVRTSSASLLEHYTNFINICFFINRLQFRNCDCCRLMSQILQHSRLNASFKWGSQYQFYPLIQSGQRRQEFQKVLRVCVFNLLVSLMLCDCVKSFHES